MSVPRGVVGARRHGIELTVRQMQVLRLAAAHKTTSQISYELDIRKDQVKEIKRRIKSNLGLDAGADTIEMLARATELGFVS